MGSVAVLLSLLSLQTGGALEVFTPRSQRVLLPNSTVLPCTFSVDSPSPDPSYLGVIWRFHDKEILKYGARSQTSLDARMSLRTEALQSGDASLHISNVRLSDGGIYTCEVVYTPERRERDISLEVQAKPIISVSHKTFRINTEDSLTCAMTGFFPPDIGVTWLRDGEAQTHDLMGKPQKNPDGTYRVTSTLPITVTSADRNRTFSCRVQHASLLQPLQEDLRLLILDEESAHGVVVVVFSILAILVMIIVAVISGWWIRNKRKALNLGVTDIEGPSKLVAGEEAVLLCRATNCQKDVSVTWLEQRGGQKMEISLITGQDMEEEERLLDPKYLIQSITGTDYSSSLRFRPNVAKHKDTTFICRYKSRRCETEKTFRCGTIYAKPELIQAVRRRLFSPGEMKYSITLEKFHPEIITIKWTCGVGETQEIKSYTGQVTSSSDGTYSVCSEVTIPENLLTNPEFRAQVSWEHEALETAEYRDFSIRDADYPWNPVVEEIQAPCLFHGTPATLQCDISEYFPGNVMVTWLKKVKGSEELEEDKEALIGGGLLPRREEANTYSCTATLTIIPTLLLHQGAAYICRVQHPSLETPIEKSTGELQVTGKPRMVEPIEITMGASSRVQFSLMLQKFYPKDIEINWSYEDKEKKHNIQPINSITSNRDLTYDVISVADTSVHSFTDPEFKVHVRWRHESLDEEEKRLLSARDLPWRPHVGEIIIIDKQKVTLTCEVSYELPCLGDVTWYKKEPGSDSDPILTPLSGDPYRVTLRNTAKLWQKTSSWESCLSFSPSLRDQGAEFLCRVEHPSLEGPIERSTGPIQIGPRKPMTRGLSNLLKINDGPTEPPAGDSEPFPDKSQEQEASLEHLPEDLGAESKM